MFKPTKQQELIIEYDGNAVVIAAPGSGKTYVLAQKIKSNLKVLHAHQGVIAISYTNKASNELKYRSLSNGENPLSSFFGTIDKFYLSEIVIPFGKQIWGIPKNNIQVVNFDSFSDSDKDIFEWISERKTLEQIKEKEMKLLEAKFLDGIIIIESIGALANYVFDNSLACRNYIRSRYRYIYIDEYQDSGPEQHKLFLKINALNIKAMAVGDINQSIYAFSGKDSRYLIELSHNSLYKLFPLNKNHRCHVSIINYSNYLLNPKTALDPCLEKRIFYYNINGDESRISDWIHKHIYSFEKLFKISERNKIAILTRTSKTGEIINSTLQEKHKLFITPELDMNLNVWSGLFSGLLYYIFDYGIRFMDVIEQFQLYSKISNKAKEELFQIKKTLDDYKIGVLIDYTKLEKLFVRIAEIVTPNSENLVSVNLLNETLSDSCKLSSYYPAGKDEINIMTLHKSKGLEFDMIIHLDLYEWILPSKKPGLDGDFDNPIYNDFEQDLNLHYVGITRARKASILISSSLRTNFENQTKRGNPSEFLLINGINNLRYNCI